MPKTRKGSPAHFPETMRINAVNQYKHEFEETGVSIDQFAKDFCIHHTTLRQWLKRYDPEFYVQRGRKVVQTMRKTQSETTHVDGEVHSQGIQIEEEWYGQQPLLPSQAQVHVEDHRDKEIADLRSEVGFLKKQVVYWMNQGAVA